jgi:hypothetical protein
VPSKGLELEPVSGRERSGSPLAKSRAEPRDLKVGAIEGTRTPTPLPVHGPEPCASANSATMALWTARQRRPRGRRIETAFLFYRRKVKGANRQRAAALPDQSCQSRPLAGFRCRFSRGARFLARYGSSLFLFGCGFDRRQQFHVGLFCRAMMAMPQRLDARSFFFPS